MVRPPRRSLASEALRALCLRHTQDAIAARLGISQALVSQFCTGVSIPLAETALLMEDALGISMRAWHYGPPDDVAASRAGEAYRAERVAKARKNKTNRSDPNDSK